VGSIPASIHGGRAPILYLWWYASPGAAADQPGVQDWYIPFTVRTDHRPLLFPLKLDFMRSRHHRWEEQLAQFDLHLTYRERRLNIVPDALSRRPDHKAEPPAGQPVLAAVSSLNPDPVFLTSVQEATSEDAYAQMVISRMVLVDTEFATFLLDDGLLYNSDRLYIPPAPELRTRVMHAMHDCNVSGHLGMDKLEELTSRSFFWPDLQQDVWRYVRSCYQCQRNKASNRRPGGFPSAHSHPPTEMVTYHDGFNRGVAEDHPWKFRHCCVC
jgi:hypothetical protein